MDCSQAYGRHSRRRQPDRQTAQSLTRRSARHVVAPRVTLTVRNRSSLHFRHTGSPQPKQNGRSLRPSSQFAGCSQAPSATWQGSRVGAIFVRVTAITPQDSTNLALSAFAFATACLRDIQPNAV